MSLKNVIVGMSGGVDSTASALLLKNRGYNVFGVIMRLYDESYGLNTPSNSCFSQAEPENIEFTKNLAKRLDIPFEVIDLREEFKSFIIEKMKDEYKKGRTPNPCVWCNRYIKFGFLFKKALEIFPKNSFFATGHYARIEKDDKSGLYLLKKSIPVDKDQSYFLSFLTKEQLSRTIFPLYGLAKDDVRKIAASVGLDIAKKKESQDFMGGEYKLLFSDKDFRSGEIVTCEGRKVGKHNGIINYTIGQRKGLPAMGYPIYVKEIDAKRNRIVISEKKNLFSKSFTISNINVSGLVSLADSFKANVKIRQQHRGAEATIEPAGDKSLKITFDEPQLSVTPGQTAVAYSKDTLLFAGIID